MAQVRGWAVTGFTAALMVTAAPLPLLAQDKPTLRVWSGDQPPADWVDPRAEAFYVSRPPADAAETRRIERLMDHVLDAYPSSTRQLSIVGTRADQFQPRQAVGRSSYGILLRLPRNVMPLAFGGRCGQFGHSRYMTAPAEWFDAVEGRDWASAYPELSLAMAVGWRQAHGYCADIPGVTSARPGETAVANPTTVALNGLGAALGYSALWGGRDRAGQDWSYASGGEIILRSGIRSFDGDAGLTNWTGLGRRLAGVRRVDHPLFETGPGALDDVAFWSTLGRVREWRFLNTAYATQPSDPNSAASVRDWLDGALVAGSGSDLGLARSLAVLNWSALIGNGVIPRRAEGQGVFAREVWQGAMVGNGGGGCLPVDLSLNDSVRELDFTLREAATNCIVVRWSGQTPTPKLPPVFTVVADAGEAGADALDGLHLTAHQNWQPRRTQGAVEVEILSQVGLLRPGVVVEDTQRRQAVKTWEVIHNPDPAFADQGMTIALTNLHPDGEARTRPMNLRLTVGPGAHAARQSVRAVAAHREQDCGVRDVPIGAAAEAMPAQTAFHIAAIDPEDFSISGYFLPGGTPDLLAQLAECGRVQMAQGTVLGVVAGGERPDGPNVQCQGVSTEMTALGSAAMAAAGSGGVQNFTGGAGMPGSQLEFTIQADRAITGPGRYPARMTAGLLNPALERQGLILPQSIDGEGEIVVERATSGAVVVRYQARFSPVADRCSPRLDGTISGTLHAVAALPMSSRSARTLTLARPVEMLGEKLWTSLSPAERAAMNAQPRGENDGEGAPTAGFEAGAAAAVGLGCDLTDAQVDAILGRLLAGMPAAVRATYQAEFRSDPETARRMACLYKDAV